jgi:hypothetical protein
MILGLEVNVLRREKDGYIGHLKDVSDLLILNKNEI